MFQNEKSTDKPDFAGFLLHNLTTFDRIKKWDVSDNLKGAEKPYIIEVGEVEKTINLCVAIPVKFEYHRNIQSLLADGIIEKLKQGYYSLVDDFDTSEVNIIKRLFPDAVLCMNTALFYHTVIVTGIQPSGIWLWIRIFHDTKLKSSILL